MPQGHRHLDNDEAKNFLLHGRFDSFVFCPSAKFLLKREAKARFSKTMVKEKEERCILETPINSTIPAYICHNNLSELASLLTLRL